MLLSTLSVPMPMAKVDPARISNAMARREIKLRRNMILLYSGFNSMSLNIIRVAVFV